MKGYVIMKKLKRKDKEVFEELEKLFLSNNVLLKKFEIYYNAFGDVIIEFYYNDKNHLYTSDRGDIYYNGSGLMTNSERSSIDENILKSVFLCIKNQILG